MTFDPITYFQNIAAKHKSIAHTANDPHFFKIRSLATLDDLLNSISIASYPALLVHDTIDGVVTDAYRSDNYMNDAQIVFYVVKRVEYEDETTISTAITECQEIGRQILARMLADKSKAANGLMFLDFSRIPYQSVGPLADNVFGVMYMISVMDDADMTVEAEVWYE